MEDYQLAVDETIACLENYVFGIEDTLGRDATDPDRLFNFEDCRNLVLRHSYFFMFPVLQDCPRNESALAIITSQLYDIASSTRTQIVQAQALPNPFSFLGFIEILLRFREIEQSAFWVQLESYPDYAFDYSQLQCSSGDIRLLSRAQESSTQTHQYRYNLEVKSLSSGIPYNTLSYTWGSPLQIPDLYYDDILKRWWNNAYWLTARFPIIINNQIVLIPPNFAEFLIIHNLPTEPPFLWVDFCCINQSDLEDKKIQIEMMHLIYEQAQKVLFWLGAPGAQIASINSLLRIFNPVIENRVPGIALQGADLNDPRYARFLNEAGVTFEECNVLWAYFCTLWGLRNSFHRRWILQEMNLNETIVVFLGGQCLALQPIFALYEHLNSTLWLQKVLSHGDAELLVKYAGASSRVTSGLQFHLRALVHELQPDRFRPALSERGKLAYSSLSAVVLLADTYNFRCAVSQDYLIAVHAIMQKICTRMAWPNPILTETHQSVESLFTQFATACILAEPNLVILLQCLNFPRGWYESSTQETRMAIPSWVPDFHRNSVLRFPISELIYQTGRELVAIGVFDPDVPKDRDSDYEVLSRRSVRDGKLRLRGRKLGPIRSCLSNAEDADQDVQVIGEQYGNLFAEYLQHRGPSLSQAQRFLKFSNPRLKALDPDDNAFEFYLMFCMLEPLFRGEHAEAELARQRGLELARMIGVDPDDLEVPVQDPIPSDTSIRDIYGSHFPSVVQTFGNRAMTIPLLTEDYMLGLGPLLQRVGDGIWLLEGVRFPLLLRKVEDESSKSTNTQPEKVFKIIGPVTLDGFVVEDMLNAGLHPLEEIAIV